MSSLLSKLKTLLSAGARGPRQYEREPTPPEETESPEAPAPEVTDAPAHQRDLPAVTEAPLAEPTARPAGRQDCNTYGACFKNELRLGGWP